MKNPLETLAQIGMLVLVATFVGAGAGAVVGLISFLVYGVYSLLWWSLVGAVAGLASGLLAAFDSGHRFERAGMWVGLLIGCVGFSILLYAALRTAPPGALEPAVWEAVFLGSLSAAAGFLAGFISERLGRTLAEFLDLE